MAKLLAIDSASGEQQLLVSLDQILLALSANVQALTPAATLTLDATAGVNATSLLNQAGHTVDFVNTTPGARGVLVLTQDGAGSRTVTSWTVSGGTVVFASGTAPVLASGAAQSTTLEWVRVGADIVIIDSSPLDAQLQAIANLTPTSDSALYFTSETAAALMTVTDAARDLLDDEDSATQRGTLGLTIGTDVQEFNANLQGLAALTAANNYGFYFTDGGGSMALMSITVLSRTLLEYNTVSNWRAELGVTQSVKTSVSAAFGTVALGPSTSHFDIALTGITANDAVVVSPRADLHDQITIKQARCATTNTLRVSLFNHHDDTVNVGTVTLDVAYMR